MAQACMVIFMVPHFVCRVKMPVYYLSSFLPAIHQSTDRNIVCFQPHGRWTHNSAIRGKGSVGLAAVALKKKNSWRLAQAESVRSYPCIMYPSSPSNKLQGLQGQLAFCYFISILSSSSYLIFLKVF
jgi:hypothetical protein